MRRRLAAIAATLAFALLVPVATVSADSIAEPTGSYVYVSSEPVCDNSTLLCTSAQLSYGRTADGDFACLTLYHSDNELGGVIYETESGCGDPSTVFGAFAFTNGFLTGIGSTTLNLTSDLGPSRDVTFSGSFVASGKPVGSTTRYDILDYPDEGCITSYMARQKLVGLTGTLTIGGFAFPVSGDSRNVQSKLSKPRC